MNILLIPLTTLLPEKKDELSKKYEKIKYTDDLKRTKQTKKKRS